MDAETRKPAPRTRRVPDRKRYEFFTPGKKSGGITIPKTGRFALHGDADGMVGPGAYEISRNIVSRERGTFGREKRVFVGPEKVGDAVALGPGSYYAEDDTFKKGNGKGFSLVGKPRAQSASQNKIGPGQYYKDEKLGVNEAYSIPKAGRGDLSDGQPNRVGPGQYGNLRDKSFGKKGVSFAKSTRDGKQQGSGVGPGQYSAQQSKVPRPVSAVGTFGTADRRIGERLEEKGSAKNLGPGYYTSKQKDKKTGWSFGKEGRGGPTDNQANPLGPGAYNVKAGLGSKLGVIGRAPKSGDASKNNVPFYSLPATVPDVPKYLLPPKHQRKIGQ